MANRQKNRQADIPPDIRKRGSFSFEIAILFPILLGIIFCFIWQMTMIRCEMLFRSIIIKEAEKISIIGVLSEFAPGLYKTVTGETPDDEITELILNGIYGISLKKQIQDHYNQLCAKNSTFRSLIYAHDEFIESSVFEDGIRLTSTYSIYTPFRIIQKQFTIPLRLWDHGDHSGKIEESEDANIWDYDNFNRGKVLRRRFGGNLPFGFPVLSGYSNGNILIIKSMDLTAATWESPQEVKVQMQESIDAVSSYQGTSGTWGEEKITINSKDIRGRFVIFIIPQNTQMEKYSRIFDEIRNARTEVGMQIEIIPYQESRRKPAEQ